MTVLSVRGLDAKARAELKARAASEGASVNAFVLRLIEQAPGPPARQAGAAAS